MRYLNFFLTFLLTLSWLPSAQAAWWGEDDVSRGLDSYEAGRYEEAVDSFTSALLEAPSDPLLNYNLGNALYKLGRFEDAQAQFQKVAESGATPDLREKALYNLGNTYFQQGKLEEAVQALEAALKLDPNDADAKRNLEIVRQEIRRRLEEMKDQQQQRGQQQQQGQGAEGEDNQGEEGQQQPSEGQEGQENSGGESQGEGAPTPSPRAESGNQNPQGQEGGEEQPGAKAQQGQQGEPGQQGQNGQQAQPNQQGQGQQGQGGEQAKAAQAQGESGEGQGEGDAGSQATSSGGPVPEGAMSQQDAERLLQQLQEDGREMQRQYLQRGNTQGRTRGKAW